MMSQKPRWPLPPRFHNEAGWLRSDINAEEGEGEGEGEGEVRVRVGVGWGGGEVVPPPQKNSLRHNWSVSQYQPFNWHLIPAIPSHILKM